MRVVYGVFEGDKLIKITDDKNEAVDYIKRHGSNLLIAKKYIRGEHEWEQSHWMFYSIKGNNESKNSV